MSNESKCWYVYCLQTISLPTRHYIGATVDLDRRLQQHNGVLKGGAKRTSQRPGDWQRICYVSGFQNENEALSFEWHWKRFSKKAKWSMLEGLTVCLEWAKEKRFGALEVMYE